MSDSSFTAVDQLLASGDLPGALAHLCDELRRAGRYHQLFDVRLMQTRQRLGMPLAQTKTLDELDEQTRTKLEDAYIEHCREIGALFLQAGQVREAWMYLRPTGDKQPMAAGLAALAITPDNLEPLIEIALHERVAPELGYRLVLEHYGTCNAITMFDSLAHTLSRSEREALATMLVRHLHHELSRSVRADIERREGAAPPAEHSLLQCIADRPELFADLNYHVDASHLAATIKSARLLTDPAVLELALELAEYGTRLDRTYRYPGDAPFADHYPASALFFAAQLGQRVDEALDYFQRAADQADSSAPLEVLIALSVRLERYDQALTGWQKLLSSGMSPSGFAPSLIELAQASGRTDDVAELFRQQGDLVSYVAVKGTR